MRLRVRRYLEGLVHRVQRMQRNPTWQDTRLQRERKHQEDDIAEEAGTRGVLLGEVVQQRRAMVRRVGRERLRQQELVRLQLIAHRRVRQILRMMRLMKTCAPSLALVASMPAQTDTGSS